MKDYQPLLDKFAKGWASFFTGKVYSGIPTQVEDYLATYWLDMQELNQVWIPIRNKVFPGGCLSFPDNMFPNDFNTMLRVGGSAIHSEEYLKCLQQCMEAAGDHFFVVIEDHIQKGDKSSVLVGSDRTPWPAFRFKYPVSVSFKQIMNGEYLSEEVLRMGDRDYFIFGDTGSWGIYAGDDVLWSLHIIGCQKGLSDTFNRNFPAGKLEKQIPGSLKNVMDNIRRLKENQSQ